MLDATGLQKWVRVSPYSQAMCHLYGYHKTKQNVEKTAHKCQSSAWPLGKAFLEPGRVASPSGKSISFLVTPLRGRHKEELPHILMWLPNTNGPQQHPKTAGLTASISSDLVNQKLWGRAHWY